MRYLLKDNYSAESLLDQLAQGSFRVVEGAIPDYLSDDIRVGLYVALHQVLANALVKSLDCGDLPTCADLREENPFGAHPPSLAKTGARA